MQLSGPPAQEAVGAAATGPGDVYPKEMAVDDCLTSTALREHLHVVFDLEY
jgi:hypothetical protein